MATCPVRPWIRWRGSCTAPRHGDGGCQFLSPLPAEGPHGPSLRHLPRHRCFVKGGAELASRLERRLGVRLDDPAGNGEWALEHVSCLGACGQAPVLVVDGALEPKLPLDDPAGLDQRLQQLGLGEAP
jgi:NADH:ubiquinone oxidoreductase 24 kD subunit